MAQGDDNVSSSSCAVCEHTFVTDAGTAYTQFQHALRTGNLMIIRAAAADLPSVRLDDALQVCVLLRDREPERYERAAVRWIGRYCVERPDATLDDVEHSCAAIRHGRWGCCRRFAGREPRTT
jgi:hypothetical protein